MNQDEILYHWLDYVEIISDIIPDREKSKIISHAVNLVILVQEGNTKRILRVSEEHTISYKSFQDYQFEVDILQYLKEQGLSVAYPLDLKDGSKIAIYEGEIGKYYCTLFSFADGIIVFPYSDNQLFNLGVLLAKLHINLLKYKHKPSIFDWSLESGITKARDLFHSTFADTYPIEFEKLKDLTDDILARFNRINDIPTGFIHGDAHNLNMHFNKDIPTLFDFDTICKNYLIADLVSLIFTQRFIQMTSQDVDQKFSSFQPLIDGYTSIRILSESELKIFPLLATQRILQLITIWIDVLKIRPNDIFHGQKIEIFLLERIIKSIKLIEIFLDIYNKYPEKYLDGDFMKTIYVSIFDNN